MKPILVLVVLLAFFINSLSAQTILVEKTTLKDVKVFFVGAEISRNFTVSIPQGKTELQITNLSSDLDPNSLVITSDPFVKIVSIYNDLNYENNFKKDSELQLITDSITYLQDRIKFKDMQYDALEEEKKTLLKNSVRVGNVQGLSINEMDQTSSYLRKKQEEINSILVERQEEQKKYQEGIKKLETKKSKLVHIDSTSANSLFVLIESPLQQKVTFNLMYYVRSCGWAPTYNIYSGTDAPLELDYKANVLNNSGENWNNIHLTLIAGNPSRSLTLPVMETWALSYSRKKRTGKVYALNGDGNEGSLSKKQIKNGQSANEVLPSQEIEVEEGEMIFDIEGNHTIPSNKQQYLVDVNRSKLDASYLYQCVPKIEAKAYLIAKVKNWENLKLIEGDANVFFNNTYVGRTYIDPLGAGDTLDFSLGPDPAIQITRVKKKDFSTRKLIGLQLVENFSYEIDVRNLNKKAITIEVFDQIPIAQQEEIQINLEEKDGADYQSGNGKLSWKIDVPALQTVKLKMGYSVKYPRDKVVVIKRTGRVLCPKFR